MPIFNLDGEIFFEVNDVSTRHNEYFSFDMIDSLHNSKIQSYMTKDKLRSLAVFILNLLEKNND